MDADTAMGTELRRLRRRRPEVAGTVLAGTDGLLISSDLPTTDATHLAALSAASFGLGQRVADTVRHGAFRESVVRSTTGCVVTYPAGRHALLTLIIHPAADLDTLHEEARAVAARAGSVFDSHRTAVRGVPVPDAHAPLAIRTPMATLHTRQPGPATTWQLPRYDPTGSEPGRPETIGPTGASGRQTDRGRLRRPHRPHRPGPERS